MDDNFENNNSFTEANSDANNSVNAENADNVISEQHPQAQPAQTRVPPFARPTNNSVGGSTR